MSDKYIFLFPSQMNLSDVQREVKNEPRRLELSLDGVTPLTRCEISIGPQPEQYNLLTISILIITMSSFNYKGSISMTINICEAFGSINNTGQTSF